jgi:2'-5' RNA ligase
VSGPVTLGVAIAIPDPHAAVLSDWRRRSGDRAADLMWPHVTLLPPTPVAQDDLAAIEEHLANAARTVEPFEMHLSGTGTFRPVSPVVFVQVARGVSDCEVLEATVRSGPLSRELDFPYHPHVTVAQLVAETALDEVYDGLATFAARFVVSSFQLFCRQKDGRWQTRSEFVLGARG